MEDQAANCKLQTANGRTEGQFAVRRLPFAVCRSKLPYYRLIPLLLHSDRSHYTFLSEPYKS
jgi:hypothetical protein